MTEKKAPPDWKEIERDFRTGAMSVREIATWYGISDTAIRKKAAAGGWVRQNADFGSHKKAANQPKPAPIPKVQFTHDTASPELILGRGRNLVLRMLDELEATTSRLDELDALITSTTAGDDQGRQALQQAVSLKQRSEVLKSLATAAKTLAESATAAGPAGKKAERQKAAEDVGSKGSKFAPAAPPKLVVDNR